MTDLVEDGLDLVTAGRTGVTRAILSLRGSNAGVPFATTMLYTRTWTHDNEHGWRVLAAHITPLS